MGKKISVGKAAMLFAVASLVVGSAGFARAEDAKSSSFMENTKVTGSADVNYNYNFNRPTTTAAGGAATNGYRYFDNNANSFNVGLVELAIENTPADWITFRTDLNFGHDASLIHSGGFGAGTDIFDLQQAYIALKAPIGSGLTFKAGKFVTMHGAEVIEAAANSNISRSFLFNYAIPLTHTGIMANYAFTDWLTLDLGVVNGWDVVTDNNNGKTIHGQFTIKPTDKLTWIIGSIVGPEATNIDGQMRFVLDTTLSYVFNDQWNVALNYDLGRDATLVAAGASRGFSDWQGIAAYVNWKPYDTFGLSLRGEYFKDDVGRMAGNLTGATASTKVYEGTLTSHLYLAEGLDLRFELRHDQGNNASFLKGNGTSKKFQDTIASQLVYSF